MFLKPNNGPQLLGGESNGLTGQAGSVRQGAGWMSVSHQELSIKPGTRGPTFRGPQFIIQPVGSVARPAPTFRGHFQRACGRRGPSVSMGPYLAIL